jgi:hypothetical protein
MTALSFPPGLHPGQAIPTSRTPTSDRSASNHPTASPTLLLLRASARRPPVPLSCSLALEDSGTPLGFAHSLVGSPCCLAESSSLSCGPVFHLQLLSTPPFGDAVTFGYMRMHARMVGTSTQLSVCAHGRTRATASPPRRSQWVSEKRGRRDVPPRVASGLGNCIISFRNWRILFLRRPPRSPCRPRPCA